MHDPQTVAFEIRYPWRKYRKPSNDFEKNYRESFITIWHVDPEKDGTDDSCGWFMRARHGDQDVLKRIVSSFEFDFDRTFTSDGSGSTYLAGLFCPNGDPHLSVHGIVLNLFFLAAIEYFSSDGLTNWKKARKWMQRHLADILLFAENPTDSLHDTITRKFEIGCGEVYTPERRNERVQNLARIIYAWILRTERPWYREPRWHIHHWKIQCHPLQNFKRWAFSRCCKCGGRFTWGYSPVSNSWNGTGPRWFKSETDVAHSDCDRPGDDKPSVAQQVTP